MKNTSNNYATIHDDFYSFGRNLSDFVTDYMSKTVWLIAARKRVTTLIQANEREILASEYLRGSVLWPEREQKNAQLLLQNEQLKQKLAADLALPENRVEYPQAFQALYNAYKKASADAQVYSAIEQFFTEYGKAPSMELQKLIVSALGGVDYKRGASAPKIVRSEGTVWTVGKRSKSDFMRTVIGLLCEIMLEKGTVKAASIPEDIRAEYAPKKKANK